MWVPCQSGGWAKQTDLTRSQQRTNGSAPILLYSDFLHFHLLSTCLHLPHYQHSHSDSCPSWVAVCPLCQVVLGAIRTSSFPILFYPLPVPVPEESFRYHQKRCLLVLAYHGALLLCIFFHFRVYLIESIPSEKGRNLLFFTQTF